MKGKGKRRRKGTVTMYVVAIVKPLRYVPPKTPYIHAMHKCQKNFVLAFLPLFLLACTLESQCTELNIYIHFGSSPWHRNFHSEISSHRNDQRFSRLVFLLPRRNELSLLSCVMCPSASERLTAGLFRVFSHAGFHLGAEMSDEAL